ncbi:MULTISPECIES: hypothetical protein [unclassified Haladaptatus]|uniref:DUF7115 domain-containing protein n=1 Tax=unclassified Haladaptatus TaxID=2622732 RepID=UPI00209BFD6D|nr:MULTISPECIES: hypothetical protein [unclassified Haladaptatus]MCO8243196.1 hypothetical protein [Haladaptatus sp. AB643]MCO8252908.1 hypothetical protein [Haladaptatus sp. AB618]
MNVPGIVQSSLGDEHVAAKVSLGGEDTLYVTPTRTLIYRADGLLSDESVEEYPHDAERITVSEGRRKSSITLDYGIDGTEQFKIPSKRLHDALHPVIAGVLNGAGVTDSNEQVLQTYQFSELTLVLTSARVVKHVGEAIWDTDFEQFHFADVTRLDVEEGNVSSQIIIEADGRPQRIKTPTDRTREVRERIEQGLLSYHDVGSYAEFEQRVTPEDPEPEPDENVSLEDDDVFGGGVKPLDANPPELDTEGQIIDTPGDDPLGDSEPQTTTESQTAAEPQTTAESRTSTVAEAASTEEASDRTEATGTTTSNTSTTTSAVATEPESEEPSSDEPTGFADSGFESASENLDDPVESQLAALTETVERQNELLERQQKTIEQLIAELSRGR